MFDLGRVGLCLLQQGLSFGDEFHSLMFLREGKCIGCQDHSFVVPALLTPDPGKGQPRIDCLRCLPDNLLEKLFAFFQVSAQKPR